MRGSHCKHCERDFPSCPCVTCKKDNYTGEGRKDSPCCMKRGHNRLANCNWGPCPDYEKEEEAKE